MMKSLWNSFKIALCDVFKDTDAPGRLVGRKYALYALHFFRLSVQLSGWSCLAWNGSAVILE